MAPVNISSVIVSLPHWAYPTTDSKGSAPSFVSPQNNGAYSSGDVALTYAVSDSNLLLSYSLDGQANFTLYGNTTLSGLSNGSHNVTAYATDVFGNTAALETISFIVKENIVFISEPFQTTVVIAVSGASVAVAGAIALFYFKKRKRYRE